MSKLGAVRSVEVKPSVPGDPTDPAATATAAAAAKAAAKAAAGSSNGSVESFDVHALLEHMPQPRALAKGSGSLGAGRTGAGGAGGGRSGGGGGGGRRRGEGGVGGGMSVDLHVDAWVQFTSLQGFERALKTLRGRVLQKAGAELLCEYRLGVDVTGYMTEERRRERVAIRAREAQEVRVGPLSVRVVVGERLFGGILSARAVDPRVSSCLPVNTCREKHGGAAAGRSLQAGSFLPTVFVFLGGGYPASSLNAVIVTLQALLC